jgi:hypothetical protein
MPGIRSSRRGPTVAPWDQAAFFLNGWATYDFDLTTHGRDIANTVTLVGGKAVAAGVAENNSSSAGGAIALVRTQSALIFNDGFERGSESAW